MSKPAETNETAQPATSEKETVNVKAVPEEKAVPVEPEEKKEEKPAEKKPAKPAASKAEKAEEKPAKKAAAKKPAAPAKKADKPELKPEVYIEFGGNTAVEAQVIDRIKAKYVAEGHRASSIKSLRVYMKPEEGKAYYVLNEKEKPGQYVDLY